MTELTLTPTTSPHSIGDDRLADRCRQMIEALRKLGIGLIPKRISQTEIELYYHQREQSLKMCDDGTHSDPYLVDAWIIFESLSDSDSDKFYQVLQDLGIFDDFNYDFSGGDYDE